MKKEFELLPPTMPSSVRYKVPGSNRQNGFDPENNRFPVSELTEKEAEEFAELMKQTFLQHWRKSQSHNLAPSE